MAITHSKVSAVADGADTSKVRPTDWNADHTASDATVSASGLMSADDKKQLTAQAEATTTGNVDIDFALGFDVEVGPTTGNIDIDLLNGEAGRWHSIKIEYGGAHTVTFNDTINWAGDSAPTATSVSGKHDFYFLYRNRAGTEWFGSSGSQDHP